jgi:hypothetical protein
MLYFYFQEKEEKFLIEIRSGKRTAFEREKRQSHNFIEKYETEILYFHFTVECYQQLHNSFLESFSVRESII